MASYRLLHGQMKKLYRYSNTIARCRKEQPELYPSRQNKLNERKRQQHQTEIAGNIRRVTSNHFLAKATSPAFFITELLQS
jgi:hypothetical protein